jgi:tetrahydrodipicolinate N-succinyltransferase
MTHDGGVHVFRKEIPALQHFGKIKIGNNCMIGINSIIVAGVTIGDNCVIGAGSVVTRDIPSGSFAFGVPARVLMPIEKYKEKFLEAWKTQKPHGYGESLDPARVNDVEYVSKQLAREFWKIREHFEKSGII